jgi:hypothetical protein
MAPALAFLNIGKGEWMFALAAEMARGGRARKACLGREPGRTSRGESAVLAELADLVSTILARYLNSLRAFSWFL